MTNSNSDSSSSNSSSSSTINNNNKNSSSNITSSDSKSSNNNNSNNSNSSSNSSQFADIIAGAAAGVASRAVCHPIDTLKARFQATSFRNHATAWSVLQLTWREEGVRGLYRGIGAAAVGGVPGTVAYLLTYEVSRGLEGAIATILYCLLLMSV